MVQIGSKLIRSKEAIALSQLAASLDMSINDIWYTPHVMERHSLLRWWQTIIVPSRQSLTQVHFVIEEGGKHMQNHRRYEAHYNRNSKLEQTTNSELSKLRWFKLEANSLVQ